MSCPFRDTLVPGKAGLRRSSRIRTERSIAGPSGARGSIAAVLNVTVTLSGPVPAVGPPERFEPCARRNTPATTITTATAAAVARYPNGDGSRDDRGSPASTLRTIWRSTRSK